MAETTTTTNKMFLDKTGLGIFWGIIKGHLANKADKTAAVGKLSISNNEETPEKDKTQITINVTAVDGSTALTPVVLNSATTGRAGLMSATDKADLDSLKETINANTDFKGLKIDNVQIATENTADLALKLETESINGTDGEGKDVTVKKSYIILYDKNNAAAAAKVDVSDFVKNSILTDSSVVIADGKTQLGLTFDYANGETKTEYIDVSSLVNIYTAGEGLTLSDNAFKLVAATNTTLGGIKTNYVAAEGVVKTYAVKVDNDGNAYVAVPWENDNTEYSVTDNNTYVKLQQNGTVFSINETKLATDIENLNTTKVDSADGDDYVAASVSDTKVTVSAKQDLINAVNNANSAVQSASGDNYVNATVDGKEVKVSATTNLTTAINNANSAVQNVTKAQDETLIEVSEKSDNVVTISATNDLKNAVTKANSAVQSAEGDTYVNASVDGTKVKVAATTALTDAVNNANSAVQEINIGSIKLNKTNNTVEHDVFVSTFAMTEADIKAICV